MLRLVWAMILGGLLLAPMPFAQASPGLLPVAAQPPHGPILIEGDANFTSTNGVVGGGGTSPDPYVISGWNIDANATDGIIVRNTTVPFVIRDTFVHAGNVVWAGILLENVTHAAVTNVTVSMTVGQGIGIWDSNQVNISNSTIGGWDGLWFLRSTDSSAYANTVLTTGGSGVLIVESSRITVSGNLIRGGSHGVESDQSDNSTISWNRIQGPLWYSVTLFLSRSMTLTGNVMTYWQSLAVGGIELNVPFSENATNLPYADSHTITPDNTILGLPVLYYKDCRDTSVDGVAAGQVILAGCDRVVLSHLRLDGSSVLVTISYTVNWTLTRNSFYGGSIEHSGTAPNELGVVNLNNFYGTGFSGNGAEISFNLPYPIGGNYWSYYHGVDRCSGQYQRVCPDPDGIGDTRKNVSIFGVDFLPRMQPVDPNNTAPNAAAAATPSSGVPSTAFAFNASASTDAQDPSSALEVRWDWNADGVWDSNWSSSKSATHSFQSPGTYVVGLEVRDTEGWLSMASVTVTVGPTPLLELLADNWIALVLVAGLVAAAGAVAWRKRPRSRAPVSDGPPEEELAP